MQDHILVRYGELSLKKSNRNQFVLKITRTIKRALNEFKDLEYDSQGMRFYIRLNNTDPSLIIPHLEKIPGIYSFSIVSKCKSTTQDICECAKALLQEELTEGEVKSIKLETNRGDKSFPMTSLEISKEISRYLFRNVPHIKADMYHPDILINLDVRREGTYIFTKVYKGLGGMPSGSLGKGMLMVSGGIDSIVAGWLAIKKGMQIEAVHFSSPPYTSDQAVQKVVDLLEKLTPYTEFQSINLHIVPFTEIQQAIYEHCREDYGITIMRRMMYRITEGLANKLNGICIVNGENIGQVASQTLESMQTINEVTTLPVIRPLATFDKREIIDISINIGTYDISVRPYEDCCTVFVPKHPQIRPLKEKARFEETKFAYEEMIERAINDTKRVVLKKGRHYDVFDTPDDIF